MLFKSDGTFEIKNKVINQIIETVAKNKERVAVDLEMAYTGIKKRGGKSILLTIPSDNSKTGNMVDIFIDIDDVICVTPSRMGHWNYVGEHKPAPNRLYMCHHQFGQYLAVWTDENGKFEDFDGEILAFYPVPTGARVR